MIGKALKNVWVPTAGVLAMMLGACGSADITNVDPSARWSYVESSDVTVNELAGNRYDIDFHTVALGSTATVQIRVENVGGASMIVLPPNKLRSGFETDIPPAGLPVNVAETKTINLSFRPTEELAHDWSGQLAVSDYADQNLSISLRGVGQTPAFSCDASKLDFGRVLKGRKSSLSFSCTNHSDVTGTLIVSPIVGDQRALFVHKITGDSGRLTLGPGQPYNIDVIFNADVTGNAIASLEILHETSGGLVRVANVGLEAFTIDHAIACTPSALDFGFVAPGKKKSLEVTCVNQVSEPVQITGIDLTVASPTGGPFSWQPTETPIDIPAFSGDQPGEQRIIVTFGPTALDLATRKNDTLVIASNDEMTSRIDVKLTGFAGGPVISCSPSRIVFGQVAKGVPAVRTVVCSNDGTDDPTRTDDALLVEGFESTNPAEFSAVVHGQLNSAGYLHGQSFAFDVTYDPVDEGVDSDSIRILSNDTLHPPSYEVEVIGTGRDLPPCDFEIVPDKTVGLRFGIVDKDDSSTQEFAVRNKSADIECMVQNVRLAPTCASAFSLPGGEVDLDILPAEGELRYQVKFAPTEYRPTPYTCEVLFDISHPDNRSQVVPVRGVSQLPCAVISPNYLDFGTVKPNCSSRQREFEILNTCSSPLVLADVVMNEGASDEFRVTAEPPKGTTIASGTSAIFTMAYQPKDEGTDLGSVFVYFQNVTEPYMASLAGRGAHNATQTDSFSQDERPKVDLLWVIDNSGSMTEEQPAIANNLTAFVRYAEQQEIDFHVAVTTTAVGSTGDENGRFFPVDGVSRGVPRIVTRNTPNAQEIWGNNIKVGTSGNATERPLQAAYLALTRPLVDSCEADGNCGFLRSDAHLSIIFVTDEVEQSSESVNFYLTAFRNIKGFRNTHLFNAHAIAGDKITGCTGPGGNADPADKLIAVVEATQGGLFQSICTSDWKASIEKMASSAFGFKTCFFLGNEPEDQNGDGRISDLDGEILVESNGRPKKSTGLQEQEVWSYNAVENTICFSPFYVPEPGTKLDISYRVACLSP